MLEMIAAFAPQQNCVKNIEAWTRSPRMEIMEISPELRSSTGTKKINVKTTDQKIEIGLEEIGYHRHSKDFRLLVINLNVKNEVSCKLLDALSCILIYLCAGVDAPFRKVFYSKFAS